MAKAKPMRAPACVLEAELNLAAPPAWPEWRGDHGTISRGSALLLVALWRAHPGRFPADPEECR